eukprot:Skav203421  [mRNA]  locus=scaffold1743:369136:376323:- [translate_table: standard]
MAASLPGRRDDGFWEDLLEKKAPQRDATEINSWAQMWAFSWGSASTIGALAESQGSLKVFALGPVGDLFVMVSVGDKFNPYTGTGIAASISSNRTSYIFGTKGPSLTSLGSPGFSKAKMLSEDGRCFTFDASANGYARGEGVGAAFLMPGGALLRASLCGSAANQDGRSASLTAPNGPSQQAVIRRALLEGALEAKDVGLIECHGTGTALGDPIEVDALKNVLGETLGPPGSWGSSGILPT